jgi:hypothetical protein
VSAEQPVAMHLRGREKGSQTEVMCGSKGKTALGSNLTYGLTLLGRIEPDIIRNAHMSSCKVPVIVVRLQ